MRAKEPCLRVLVSALLGGWCDVGSYCLVSLRLTAGCYRSVVGCQLVLVSTVCHIPLFHLSLAMGLMFPRVSDSLGG